MSHDAPPDAERDNVVPLRRLAVPDDRSPAAPEEQVLATRKDRAPVPLEGRVVPRWEPVRRPIFARWITDPEERRMAVRWFRLHYWHKAKFQASRSPLYVARTLWYAPRGVGRAVGTWWRWAFDRESRIRAAQTPFNDAGGYLNLSRLAGDQSRSRLVNSAVIAGLAVAEMAVTAWLLRWMFLAQIAGLVMLAGWNGRRKDRPFIEPAILASGLRKLTPEMVQRAFAAAKLCTDDEPITFLGGITKDGDGFLAYVELPFGHDADEAIKRRKLIAAGLRADETQLFMERVRGEGGHAGLVEMWLANRDPYTVLPPVTPLLEMERVDFWEPFPFGVTARREPVPLGLVWTSFLVGSVPRVGKTVAARHAACAAALDPHVRQVIFDGKGGKDWKPLMQVAYRYGSGIRAVVVEHLVETLRELVDDMNRRYERLEQLPDDVCPDGKVTPRLSRDRSMGMPLTLVAIDEVHRYLEHPVHGKEIGEHLIELVKVAPAAGFIVVLSTQKPDARAIPTSLRDSMGSRFALKCMTWQASESVLGTGTSKAGINAANRFTRAHKGVGYLLGADDSELSEQDAQVVRTYMADAAVVTAICERGRALRTSAGTLEGVAAGEELIREQPVKRLLDDVYAVFHGGEDRLWSETICERLAELNPDVYDGWDPTLLANALAPYGVDTRQMDLRDSIDGQRYNRRGVDRQAVVDAQATPSPRQPLGR